MKSNRQSNEDIINFISEFESGLTPSNLAKKLDLKLSTSKSILARLTEKGKLKKNYLGNRGFYGVSDGFQETGHGLAWRTEPKIQNFIVFCERCGITEELKIEEHYPSGNPKWHTSIRVAKEGNLTISFTGEFGFDLSAVVILIEKYYTELNNKYSLHLTPNILIIKNIEVFNDFFKLGLSPTCTYFSDLQSAMFKVYDKGDRTRVEKRTSKKIPLEFIFQNLANPDILKYSSQVTELSLKFDEMSKRVYGYMKNMRYHYNRGDISFKPVNTYKENIK